MSEADRIRTYFGRAGWRSTPGREYLMNERAELFTSASSWLHRRIPLISVCDVGCGGGADLANWRDAGVPEARLAGTELVLERAKIARGLLPDAAIHVVEGFDLPFESAHFDVCTASLVLSTVKSDANAHRLLSEMVRVTVPGGIVIAYDMAIRKPWNRNVVAVSTARLSRLWRPPDEVRHAAPFLPALDIALRLPGAIGREMVARLPRTHRMWMWRVGAGD